MRADDDGGAAQSWLRTPGGVAVRVAFRVRMSGAAARTREQPRPQSDEPRRNQNAKAPRARACTGVEPAQSPHVPPRQQHHPDEGVGIGGTDQPRCE